MIAHADAAHKAVRRRTPPAKQRTVLRRARAASRCSMGRNGKAAPTTPAQARTPSGKSRSSIQLLARTAAIADDHNNASITNAPVKCAQAETKLSPPQAGHRVGNGSVAPNLRQAEMERALQWGQANMLLGHQVPFTILARRVHSFALGSTSPPTEPTRTSPDRTYVFMTTPVVDTFEATSCSAAGFAKFSNSRLP